MWFVVITPDEPACSANETESVTQAGIMLADYTVKPPIVVC